MKKVYLAGPDVFRDDPIVFGEKLKIEASKYKLQGLYPFDNECNGAWEIYAANIDMIKSADAVIANVSPFRGPDADPGTAFEIGYALALGKPVFLYSYAQRRPYDERVTLVNPTYPNIEKFGLHQNLMLQCGGRLYVSGSPGDAMRAAEIYFKDKESHD